MRDKFFKLMLVTNRKDTPFDEYLGLIVKCVEAGVTSVQLREKSLSYAGLLEFGNALQSVLKPFAVPLIINDNVEIACELDADGVHLGQSDCGAAEARKRLGNKKLIGLSVWTKEQVEEANNLPINYIGVGAIFPTNNKKNVEKILCCNGLESLSKLSKFPIVAIGGINGTNAADVVKAGADGIAAIGAFHDVDPLLSTQNFLTHIM